MNEDAVLITLDMIKKKLQGGNIPVALTLVEELETKLESIKFKVKGVYQMTVLQPNAEIPQIIQVVNELINERNTKVKPVL